MRPITFAGLAILAAIWASCASQRRPLPPPGPPVPAPPPRPAVQAPPPQAVQAPPRPVQPPLTPRSSLRSKAFAVAMVRGGGEHSEIDAENTTQLVNLLAHNGIATRKAEVPASLPAGILDAAKAAAESSTKAGGKGDVLLLGQITPGKEIQVRMAAVDLRSGKVIDDFGNQGPPALLDEVIRRTLEQLLASVEAHMNKKG